MLVVITASDQLKIFEPVVCLNLIFMVQHESRLRAPISGCDPYHQMLIGIAVGISQRMAATDADTDIPSGSDNLAIT